jgi:glycosyltransferase involved in cell wall biosynthesis
MTKLSVLIPTTPDRKDFLSRLKMQFYDQIGDVIPISKDRLYLKGLYGYTNGTVEFLYFEDNKENSVGYKRNVLVGMAMGDYLDFIDDDDRIGENYFKRLFEGIEQNVDCCSLRGVITENGVNPLIFEHTIKYKAYKTNPETEAIRYERYPNHLNCIRSSIAKQFVFPDKNHGEDTDFATQIFNSGLLKTEYYIDEVIYFYEWMKK